MGEAWSPPTEPANIAEKAFQTISNKMSVGMDIVRDAEQTAGMPYNTLNKIQK